MSINIRPIKLTVTVKLHVFIKRWKPLQVLDKPRHSKLLHCMKSGFFSLALYLQNHCRQNLSPAPCCPVDYCNNLREVIRYRLMVLSLPVNIQKNSLSPLVKNVAVWSLLWTSKKNCLVLCLNTLVDKKRWHTKLIYLGCSQLAKTNDISKTAMAKGRFHRLLSDLLHIHFIFSRATAI